MITNYCRIMLQYSRRNGLFANVTNKYAVGERAVPRYNHRPMTGILDISDIAKRANSWSCTIEREVTTMFNIIGTIIFGAVIGFLAKFIRKDGHKVSVAATVALGVAGVVVGNLILQLFSYPTDTPGIDWIRWVVVTIVAIIFIGIYLGMSGRKRA